MGKCTPGVGDSLKRILLYYINTIFTQEADDRDVKVMIFGFSFIKSIIVGRPNVAAVAVAIYRHRLMYAAIT